MLFDKDKIKEQLTLEQVAEVVEELGGSLPFLKNGMFITETICHNLPGESHSQKLFYYDNTKLFRCYTGCHDIFDIFELVIRAKNTQYNEEWSLPRATAWVAQKFGIQGDMESFESEKIEDWKMISYYNSLLEKLDNLENKEIKDLQVYDSTVLSRLDFIPIDGWLKEGISIETMKRYGIKYYPKDCKIVLPHWNIDGKLVGIRGRSLVRQEAEMFGKYMPIKINGAMYNHPLSFALYGLNFNKDNIKRMKKAIIFEGEKSVMLYDSHFGSENNISVASCGSSISSKQFELLSELGIEELIIAYDRQFKEIGDEEWRQAVKLLKQLANKFNNYVTVSVIFDKDGLLGYKDSPIDKGKEIFVDLFKNRIKI